LFRCAEIVRIFNEASAKRVKRVKRIEWNNVSLVVDLAAVCSHFAGFIASFSSSSRLARFARSPAQVAVIDEHALDQLVSRVILLLCTVLVLERPESEAIVVVRERHLQKYQSV